MKFQLKSTYKPTGDQPVAIEKLVDGLKQGYKNVDKLLAKLPKN